MATDPTRYNWRNLDQDNLRQFMSLLHQGGIGSQVFPSGAGGYRGQSDQGGQLPEGYSLGGYDLQPNMPGGYDGGQYMAALRGPDGGIVAEDQYQRGTLSGLDKAIQAMVFSGVGAGAAGGLLGLGAGAAGGAATGAIGGGLNAAADGGNILKGALTGGALGGLAGYGLQQFGAPDAMGDYLRTGAAEGSTIGNALTGAGGQAGAVGANSIAAQMAIPSDFDPSSFFQNVADPTAALQQLPEIGQMPGAMPGMSPAGLGSIPQGQFQQLDPGMFTQGLGPLPEVPRLPWQSMPYEQTVEVSGQKPFEPMPPTGLEPFPPFDGSSLGIADAGAALAPLGPMAAMPGAMPAAVGGLGSLLDGLGGLKTILPIAGAIAGSQPNGGGTQTTQQRTDPRFDKFLYDQYLPEWGRSFDANKSGVNDTMRAGWQQQLGILNDPQIAQQLSGMRNQGLLQSQGPVAQNPFLSGGMSLPNGGQGLLGGMQYPRMPDRRSMG
jgi:hypothetical protein